MDKTTNEQIFAYSTYVSTLYIQSALKIIEKLHDRPLAMNSLSKYWKHFYLWVSWPQCSVSATYLFICALEIFLLTN